MNKLFVTRTEFRAITVASPRSLAGNPPALVAAHPNAHAHRLISIELSAVIREMETAKESEANPAPMGTR